MYEYNRNDNDIICPYCGHTFDESERIVDRDKSDGTKIECPECEKKFWVEPCVFVSYNTKRDCELNNDEHEFENLKERTDMMQCVKCGKLKLS